jgi:ribosome-associated translation inhibitor RaiA
MRSQAVFRDVPRTADLERFLFGQTEGLVSRYFGAAKKPHLVVKVVQAHHAFVCEILLTLKGQSLVMKVRKSGVDFYDCVAEAGAALRKLIKREHNREVDECRHAQTEVTHVAA